MKQLTRQEVEAVVESLAGGTDIHLCEPDCMDMECRNCITEFEPVYIGTVLEKIDQNLGGMNHYAGGTTYNHELIHLWSRCGSLSKSLQEIIEASGYMIYTDLVYAELMVLKSPEANALFSFLQEII